jgi:hypothetical protein
MRRSPQHRSGRRGALADSSTWRGGGRRPLGARGFAVFPVAPPQLAGIGLAGTVSHQAAVALTGRSIGIAAYAAGRARARALALLLGPLVSLSVVATGDHHVFDVATGLLVTGTRPRPPRRRRVIPVPATRSGPL